MLIAASVISPMVTRIGGAPDDSVFGAVRNGLTAAALFVAGAYLARASLYKFTGSTQGGPEQAAFRWILRFGALACALGGCAVLACLSGAYPGLYPRVFFALVCLAMALLVWPLSIGVWFRRQDSNQAESNGSAVKGDRPPLLIVLGFFFFAICATIVFVAQTADALRILGILSRS
jgi:hypothetical protein